MKQIVKKLLPAVGISTTFILFNALLKLGKLSTIIGSHAAFFSLNQCLTPLVGSCTSLFGISLFFFMRTITTALTLQHLGLLILVYHIPSFFGAFAFSNPTTSPSLIKRILLGFTVITCIALFIAHPIGFYAAPYTLLWLIPLILLVINKSSVLLTALTSTFIIHALGSVIMLYTTDTLTAQSWIGIIPIALIERFIFAVGTTICYYSLQRIYTLFTLSKRANVVTH